MLPTVDRKFKWHGQLDSQATSQEAIDALIIAERDHRECMAGEAATDDITSQDFIDQLDYGRQPVVYGKLSGWNLIHNKEPHI